MQLFIAEVVNLYPNSRPLPLHRVVQAFLEIGGDSEFRSPKQSHSLTDSDVDSKHSRARRYGK